MERNYPQINLWFSHGAESYPFTEEALVSPSEIEGISILKKEYDAIHTELKEVIANRKTLQNYADDGLQYPPNTWKRLPFYIWGFKNKAICDNFPVTTQTIEKIPGMCSCFISMLEPHSEIKEHVGDTNSNIRIHMGLDIPTEEKEVCGMQVKDQMFGWKNGSLVAFIDAHNHSAWNRSDQARAVLIVDVIRPAFIKYKYYIYTRSVLVIALSMLLEKLGTRIRNRHHFFITYLSWVFTPVVFLVWKLQNKLGLVKV